LDDLGDLKLSPSYRAMGASPLRSSLISPRRGDSLRRCRVGLVRRHRGGYCKPLHSPRYSGLDDTREITLTESMCCLHGRR